MNDPTKIFGRIAFLKRMYGITNVLQIQILGMFKVDFVGGLREVSFCCYIFLLLLLLSGVQKSCSGPVHGYNNFYS